MALLVLAFALAVIAALISGWEGQVSATALTALGSLAVGTALARLIPRRWFVLGVLGMCLADVALLASGVGGSAAALMASATRVVHGPSLSQADIGRVTTDYPDLVLAAVLGGFLAGRHRQLLAAVLVAVLGAAYGLLLLPIAHLLPATVPIGLALLVLESVDARRAAKAPPSGAADHPTKAPPSGAADHPTKAPPSGAADHPTTRERTTGLASALRSAG